jgi:C1A family cysteine protease
LAEEKKMKKKQGTVWSRLLLKKGVTVTVFMDIFITIMFVAASTVGSVYSAHEKTRDAVDQTTDCGCNATANETPMEYPLDGHGTGFKAPNMQLPHLTGQVLPEKYLSVTAPSSFDWRTLGKVTSVKDQGACNACYAFAALACLESKIMIDGGGTYDLSEDNVKECDWYHPVCNPSNFYNVASFLSQKGTVLESDDPYQPFDNNNPPCGTKPFQQTILDWRVIAGDSIPSTTVLKDYIYNNGPVYVSLWSGAEPYDATWQNEFSNYDGSYTLYKPWSGATDHAVIVVGWDDNLIHAGGTGGWICKNSWGTDWGGTCGYGTEKGYFTIAYGSAAIGKYSSYVDQWGKYDTNGGISYYDEGGWNYNWGYSSTTAWGLCKFGYMVDTGVSRVEFWTNDKTTDVDVYIYDSFDGQSVSNLLWSSLDHSYAEAGYHGVTLVPPLNVMGMNAIFVVVKVTNAAYQYPIVVDANGPTTTGCTYTSADGSPGSWTDRGLGTTKTDVAIRIRNSGDAPPSAPSISGTTSGKPGTSYNYDFISTDANGDKVSYFITWGDGTQTGWSVLKTSGVKYTLSHTFSSQGTYTIKAKTRDIYGLESDWGTLQVQMPLSFDNLFLGFSAPLFERFPHAFPIVRHLMGY